MPAMKLTSHYKLLLILLVALMLRLVFVLAQDPLAPYASQGSDSGWYLGTAYAIVTNTPPVGTASDGAHLTPPPLYFLVIGLPQVIFSPAAAIIAVRVLQAILSTATAYFAYRMAWRLTDRTSAGLIAAGALALNPAFIIESAQILTETLFIFLIAAALCLVVECIANPVGAHDAPPRQRRTLWLLVGAGICFGLAALTRAVLLGFPFGLAILLLLIWRGGWKRAALLLIVYALVVSTWTIYSMARWNRFVIAGAGLDAFLYLGATGWTSPQQVDQQLAQQIKAAIMPVLPPTPSALIRSAGSSTASPNWRTLISSPTAPSFIPARV